MADRRAHWDEAWTTRDPKGVSWYQEEPEPSLSLVKSLTEPSEPIIDVGGGTSRLAGALLTAGYGDVTVLDVSGAALRMLEQQLSEQAPRVHALVADVLDYGFTRARFALWHDRAVYHFLTEPADRARYRAQLDLAVRPGGHAIIGTFAADGPLKCSGLPVQRYDGAALGRELEPEWQVVRVVRHEHNTPSGSVQPFTFVVARHVPATAQR